GPADDGRGDADQLALAVEQRTARVAGVDGRVGLNDAADEPLVLRTQRAIQAADDARRQRALQAEGIADGEDAHADQQLGRVAPGYREELVRGSLDLQHGQIVV